MTVKSLFTQNSSEGLLGVSDVNLGQECKFHTKCFFANFLTEIVLLFRQNVQTFVFFKPDPKIQTVNPVLRLNGEVYMISLYIYMTLTCLLTHQTFEFSAHFYKNW